MEAFTLDTSGVVYVQSPYITDRDSKIAKRWSDLSPFVQGYIEAMLRDYLTRNLGPLASGDILGFSDLAPETLSRILKDCGPDSRGYVHPTGATMGIANTFEGGGLFWRTRQEGMWAGFPPQRTTLSNDGLIYFGEGE